MNHMYNSDDYTIDSTLSLNSNLNWVLLYAEMHDLIMSEYSIYWLSSVGYTTLLKVKPHYCISH